MNEQGSNLRTRRAFLQACAVMPATFVLAACSGQAAGGATPAPVAQAPTSLPAAAAPTQGAPTTAPAQPASTQAPTQPAPTAAPAQPAPTQAAAQALPPTPPCGDDDDPTPAQTEGPYYTPNTPERASLIEPGITGTRLVVAGAVLTTDCKPVERALVDFWHADDNGDYDNSGFRLRGHQFTDAQGRYSLETIMPGLYTGRTRHIHVKVQAPNQPVLTTQLYFPGEASNDRDSIFNSALVVSLQDAADGKDAAFNFVLEVG